MRVALVMRVNFLIESKPDNVNFSRKVRCMSKSPSLMALVLLVVACMPVSAAAPKIESSSVSGVVIESQQVDSYTYVRLKTAEGEIWAAVPKASVKTGSNITVGSAMTMHDFESKTLNKRFDRIVFGELVGADNKSSSAHGVGATAVAPLARVAKAPGANGRTVAEVVGGSVALKDKPVLVRAQVVKVSLGIMGKNWLHLQDGSGTGKDGTNDVLVTTRDVAVVGDIVTAKGTVRTDVNLGSGYNYAVLIDDAALNK
jgi:hypothetical protein